MAKPNFTGPAKEKIESSELDVSIKLVQPRIINPIPVVASEPIRVISVRPTKVSIPVEIPERCIGIFFPDVSFGESKLLVQAMPVTSNDKVLLINFTQIDPRAFAIDKGTELGKLVLVPC